MPVRRTASLPRTLAAGSAVLLIQLGAATAAADQQPDLQKRMREMLRGSIPVPAAPQAGSPRREASGWGTQTQAFAERLLLGWSAAAGSGTRPLRQSRAADATRRKPQDIQAMVRRHLRGKRTPAGGTS